LRISTVNFFTRQLACGWVVLLFGGLLGYHPVFAGSINQKPCLSAGGGVSFSLLPTFAGLSSNSTRGNQGGPQRPQTVFQGLPQPMLFFEYRPIHRVSIALVYSQIIINKSTYYNQSGILQRQGQYVGHFPGLRLLLHLGKSATIDPYLFIRLGYQVHENSELLNAARNRGLFTPQYNNSLSFQVGAGCRFYWRSSWALFTELGAGRPNYFSMGALYRL
jgi:hypothetical protein